MSFLCRFLIVNLLIISLVTVCDSFKGLYRERKKIKKIIYIYSIGVKNCHTCHIFSFSLLYNNFVPLVY